MLDVDGYRGRSGAESCRSRRREMLSHRSSFEWEEGLRDIKPRGDQSFSVLGDYLEGHRLIRSQTNSTTMTSPSRAKSQTQVDLLDYELRRVLVKKSSDGASIRTLLDEEMSKNMRFRRRSPSVIAKLMGLDALPAQNLGFFQESSPSRFHDRSPDEFKDVYEVSEDKKSPARKRSSVRKRSSSKSRRFSEVSDDFHPFEDPFLKLLHEPSSLFVRHIKEHHHPSAAASADAGHIVVLKSSGAGEHGHDEQRRRADRHTRIGFDGEDILGHCMKEHTPSLSKKKGDLERRKTKGETIPTRIVVLKPSLDGFWEETAGPDYTGRRDSRRYGSEEMLSESRERKKLSGDLAATNLTRSPRGVAREITDHMIKNSGIAASSRSSSLRSSISHRQEKICDMSPYTAESSLSQEARKRLSERWKTAHTPPDAGARGRCSGTTLADMLTLSDRNVPAAESSADLISREEILARWGSPLGINSCRSSSTHGRRRRSRSYDSPKSSEEKKNLPFDVVSSPKEKSIVVNETSFDSVTPTREGRHDSRASEEAASSERRGKDCSSSLEVAEHPSPVSVLDAPDESESSLDHFERVKLDFQETEPGHKLPESKIEDAEAEGIRLTFEDEDNLEFCYLLDILIDSGLYKADGEMLVSSCFSPDSPVDPDVFHNLETIYSQLPWPGINRKLMFDLVNSTLAEISDSLLHARSAKVNDKLLIEEVWESLLAKSTADDASRAPVKELYEMTWQGCGVDFDGLRMEIENMLNDYLMEELITEVSSF